MHGSGIVKDIETELLERKSDSEARLTTLRMLLNKRKGAKGTTMQTEPREFSRASDGPQKIENGSASSESHGGVYVGDRGVGSGGAGLQPAEIIKEVSHSLPSVQKLNDSLLTSEIVASQSMSLLDESANHMFGLMKGLHANQPPAEVRSYDPDRVNSAVACANTIYKIMRLKLDAIKVQRKLTK